MKRPIMYAIITAIIAAVAAMTIVGCDGDLGSGNVKMDEFLEKFRGTADTSVPKYTVTFSANGGSGAPPRPITVRTGTAATLPDQGNLSKKDYDFAGWSADSLGKVDNYNIGASYTPVKNITMYARWELTVKTKSEVTVLSAGTGASGGGSYVDGVTVTINAGTPPDGQQFVNWTTATSGVTFASPSSAKTTFIMPPRAVTVTANFGAVAANKFAVTVSSVGRGVSGGGSYSAGTTVTINAGSDPFGHRFKNWTVVSGGVGLVNANSRTTTFVMPENAVSVTANFEEVPTYEVKIMSEGTGASKDSSYREGDTVTINAGTASADRRFKDWTVTSGGVNLTSPNSATTKFIMPANTVTVTANFEPNMFKVTVSSNGTGKSGDGDYLPGATVAIKAGTVTDYAFKNWTSSSTNVVFTDNTGAATTFVMPPNAVTVTANFQPTKFSVTISNVATGASGDGIYTVGTKVTIKAGTHPNGLPFKKWTVAGGVVTLDDETNATTTFIMPATSVTVTASWGTAP